MSSALETREERAARLREFVRSDLRAFHEAAELCGVEPAHLRIIVDGGDPPASVILAICRSYEASPEYVVNGFDGYDEEALGLALDVVMGGVLASTVPAGDRVRLNPATEAGLTGRVSSKYSEAMAHQVARLATHSYETFLLGLRARRLDGRPPEDEIGKYSDPWAGLGITEALPDNVRRLSDSGHRSRPL